MGSSRISRSGDREAYLGRSVWHGVSKGVVKWAARCLACGLPALRLAYPAGSLGAATPEGHKAISRVGAQKAKSGRA